MARAHAQPAARCAAASCWPRRCRPRSPEAAGRRHNILASPRIRTRNGGRPASSWATSCNHQPALAAAEQPEQRRLARSSMSTWASARGGAQVCADNDVGIKLNLEVSNVTDAADRGRATRSARAASQTTLRLKDGETQVLAGLISDSDRRSAQESARPGQMPMVGRLFSNHTGDARRPRSFSRSRRASSARRRSRTCAT